MYKILQKKSNPLDVSLQEVIESVKDSSLIIIRGLPGSGKSTLAKELLKIYPDAVHYETDMFFMKDGKYRFNGALLEKAYEWCRWSSGFDLVAGKKVIVSNTFTQYWEIQPYLKMVRSVLKVPFSVIETHGNFKNIHNVPDKVINRMKERWQEVRI